MRVWTLSRINSSSPQKNDRTRRWWTTVYHLPLTIFHSASFSAPSAPPRFISLKSRARSRLRLVLREGTEAFDFGGAAAEAHYRGEVVHELEAVQRAGEHPEPSGIASAAPWVRVSPCTKEGRSPNRPCPWGDNEKRFPSTHWLFMGFGGTESAAPWVGCSRHALRSDDTPVVERKERPMSKCLRHAPWATLPHPPQDCGGSLSRPCVEIFHQNRVKGVAIRGGTCDQRARNA